jgi:hypothetical protein
LSKQVLIATMSKNLKMTYAEFYVIRSFMAKKVVLQQASEHPFAIDLLAPGTAILAPSLPNLTQHVGCILLQAASLVAFFLACSMRSSRPSNTLRAAPARG